MLVLPASARRERAAARIWTRASSAFANLGIPYTLPDVYGQVYDRHSAAGLRLHRPGPQPGPDPARRVRRAPADRSDPLGGAAVERASRDARVGWDRLLGHHQARR